MLSVFPRAALAAMALGLLLAGPEAGARANPAEPEVHGTCGMWPHARCRGADLRHKDLSALDLAGADFTGANLARVDLRGANLEGALLRYTIFPDSTFDGCVGCPTDW